MPRGELRISGMLQAAVIALVLGALYRETATDSPGQWPYWLAGYGFLAATAPWLTGGLGRNDFSLRMTTVLGSIFAVPLAVSAYWLSSSPYPALVIGCWVLLGLWSAHFLAAVGLWLRARSK